MRRNRNRNRSTLTEEGFYKALIAMLISRLRAYGENDVLEAFGKLVHENRESQDGDKKSRAGWFRVLCLLTSPYAASLVVPDERGEAWKAQEVRVLSTVRGRHEAVSLKDVLRLAKIEFRAMLKWRKECIDALTVYEEHCDPPGSVTKSSFPALFWEDLRGCNGLPDSFIKFAWTMEEGLRLASQKQDESDPLWVEANRLRRILEGQKKPIDPLDVALAKVANEAGLSTT